jgi:hypothetical protein
MEAVSHGLLFRAAEQGTQGRLAGQEDGDDEAAVHVEVGEDTEHGQGLGA